MSTALWRPTSSRAASSAPSGRRSPRREVRRSGEGGLGGRESRASRRAGSADARRRGDGREVPRGASIEPLPQTPQTWPYEHPPRAPDRRRGRAVARTMTTLPSSSGDGPRGSARIGRSPRAARRCLRAGASPRRVRSRAPVCASSPPPSPADADFDGSSTATRSSRRRGTPPRTARCGCRSTPGKCACAENMPGTPPSRIARPSARHRCRPGTVRMSFTVRRANLLEFRR